MSQSFTDSIKVTVKHYTSKTSVMNDCWMCKLLSFLRSENISWDDIQRLLWIQYLKKLIHTLLLQSSSLLKARLNLSSIMLLITPSLSSNLYHFLITSVTRKSQPSVFRYYLAKTIILYINVSSLVLCHMNVNLSYTYQNVTKYHIPMTPLTHSPNQEMQMPEKFRLWLLICLFLVPCLRKILFSP